MVRKFEPRRSPLTRRAVVVSLLCGLGAGLAQRVPMTVMAAPIPAGIVAPDPDRAAAMRTAIAAYRAGDLTTGDAAARGLSDPLARAATEWVALRTAQEKAGFDRLAAFLASQPDWPTLQLIRRKAEEALHAEARDGATVLAFFKDRAPLTPVGRYRLALALKDAGRGREAIDLVRKSWREDAYPAEVEADLLARFGGDLTPEDHRARMDALLFAENWGAALRAAEHAGLLAKEIAAIRVAVGKREPDAEKRLAAAPSALRKDPGFIFAEVQGLRRAEKLVDAAAALVRLPKDVTPFRPDDWWTERRVLARRLAEAGQGDLALAVLAVHPGINAANLYEQAFASGWVALEARHDGAAAEAFFAEAVKRAQSEAGKARAAYWQGLALEAQGKPASEAFKRAAQPALSYYGQLVRLKRGERAIALRTAPPPDLAAAAAVPGFRALALLIEADGAEFAATLAADIGPKLPDAAALSALVALGRTAGDLRLVALGGKLAAQRGFGFDLDTWPVEGFPLPDEPAVERALVYAITRQESGFDPEALSPAGARGLMQLMVATAQETSKRNGIAFSAERLTADPAFNVLVGSTHLGELVEMWAGSYVLAIASYNAGAANVRKWVAAYGDPRAPDADPVRFIEKIPFSETRTYVQKVLENLEIYRVQLDGATSSTLDEDLRRGSGAGG